MFSQLFGRYLVDKSLLNEDQYNTIINEQMTVRVKLGTIAIAEGLLSAEQVDSINQLQKQHDKRFGDIAIEKGLLTAKQIDELLGKQGSPYMQFVQFVTEKGYLTSSDLENELAEFQKSYGFSDNDMVFLKKDDIDSLTPIFIFSAKPYVTNIAGLLLRNINRFISRDFYVTKANHVKNYSYKYLATQKLVGNDTVYIGLAEQEDKGALIQVANGFSKESFDSITVDVLDAVCEFINVTSGLFASEESKRDIQLDMEPPLVYEDQTATGDFYVFPVYVDGSKLDLIISVNSSFTAGETSSVLKTDAIVSTEIPVNSKGTVILVDDSKMSRIMLGNIVKKAGFTVIAEAANGREAIEMYKSYKPDLITLDITMPEMDGLDALKEILEFDPAAKAIMITAAGQQDKLIEALKSGAKRFISKPFQEEEIINNITDVINN